jgi:hypothetical protein
MGGAYVAKPAVAPTPDPPIEPQPPGWNTDWLFDAGESGLPGSGPHPPGYEPEYSLVTTAPAEIETDDTVPVTGSLRDHSTFATPEPDSIIWTAAINEGPIALKFEGGAFAFSISSSTTFLTYWGASPDIEFDLDRDNEGDTVVLTGISTIGKETVTQTVNILIHEHEYSLWLSGDSNIGVDDDDTASVTVTLRDHDTEKTEEPMEESEELTESTLTWTATINGAAIGLKFAADADYSSSIESEYSDLGDFFGGEEDIGFDLEEEEEDRVITLRVESIVWEDELSDTMDIAVEGRPTPVSFETSLVMSGYTIEATTYARMKLKIRRMLGGLVSWPGIGVFEGFEPPPTWFESGGIDDISEITTSEDISGEKRVDASSGGLVDNYTYTFTYATLDGGNYTCTFTWTMSVTMSDGTVYNGEYIFTLSPYDDNVQQTCVISTATGLVSIFGVRMD